MIFDAMWRLEQKRDKTQRGYDREILKAVKAKDYKEADGFKEEAAHFYSTANDEIDALKSRKLVSHAIRLKVPRPSFEDKEAWEQFTYYGYVLTDKGYNDLRSSIMAFQNARTEHQMRWVKGVLIPIINALSVVGSLIIAYTALKLKH